MHRIHYAEWGHREYRDLVLSFLRGTRHEGSETALVEAAFRRLFPGAPPRFVNRGRHALGLALNVFAELRPDRPEVIVPAYICRSVVATVAACGLRPVPVDVTQDLNLDADAVERSLSERTLAVIAVHLYGCPADIERLERLCRDRRIFLIDDAAAVQGIAVAGRQLGTFGDVGVLSFATSKTLVAGMRNAGGALLANNPDLDAPVNRRWERLPPGRYDVSDLTNLVWEDRFRKCAEHLDHYRDVLRRRLSIKEHAASISVPRRMANANAVVLLHQLEGLEARIAGRIRVANLFRDRIGERGLLGFPQFREGRYLTRIVLECPAGTDIARLAAALRARGVETRRPYDVYDKPASPPTRALQLQPRLLEVPSHSQMGEAEVARICAVLHEEIERNRRPSR